MSINKTQLKTAFIKFLKSVWLFPVILTLLVIILCSLKISGSSIGVYNSVFYGDKSDPSLLAGKPQPIRSDEYSVWSLMAIAQSNNNFDEINENVGNGQDMTILGDLPHNGWSTLFRPQNIGFLVLPFDNAFALKWWLPGYLLVLSAYFFVLKLMPKKKTIAILLSSAFVLSPFLQWWYLPSTLGIIAAALFAILIFLRILATKKLSHLIAWSAVLTYVAAWFIFIFYPPFQIPVAMVSVAFLIGYIIKHRINLRDKQIKKSLLFVAGAAVISLAAVAIFISQHLPVIDAIQHSAYPGVRLAKSGEGSISHYLSSNTSPLLQSSERYKSLGETNQSEASNFLLITPLLLIPALYILYRDRKQGRRNHTTVALLIVAALFAAWAFIPGLDIIGKITLLDRVPVNRGLIGIGFANFILLVLFVNLFKNTKVRFTNSQITIYSLLIVIAYLVLDMYLIMNYPGYLGFNTGVALALPFAAIVYLFLKRYYTLALALLLLFSVACTFRINPFYVGTDVITKSTISQEIKKLNSENPKTWVGDDNYLENFASLSGARSLPATYYYPQLDLWKGIDKDGSQEDTYNRYAHANFAFDRDPNKDIGAYFYKRGQDIYYIITEACDPFLADQNVGYLMTNKPFGPGEAPCATLKTTVDYPKLKTYIYELNFDK